MDENQELRKHLVKILDWEDAHANFDSAVEGIPTKLQGIKPEGLPYSLWQLVEHIRICQWDILEFCLNPEYKELKMADYWPKTDAPPSSDAWQKSIAAFREDRKALQELARNPEVDLFAKIPHGSGQTYLRELLLVADHNAYHTADLIAIRRLLGNWK
jgi:DinB superfamily